MYAIAAIQLACVAVAMERIVVLLTAHIRNRGVSDSVAQRLQSTGDVGQSLRVDQLQRCSVGRIVYAGLLQAYGGVGRVRSAMEVQRLVEVTRLHRRTKALEWLAGTGVLLGLLAATTGPRAVALGLVTALIATCLYGCVRALCRQAVAQIDLGIDQLMAAVIVVGPAVRVFGLRPPAEPAGYRGWSSSPGVGQPGLSGTTVST